MSETNLMPGEIIDSMTGHEETWVAEQFGKSIGEMVANFLNKNDIGPYYRALIFVLKRRDGVNEDDARNAVLDMKISDIMAFFPSDYADEAEESGKDEPPSELQLESSPISASEPDEPKPSI